MINSNDVILHTVDAEFTQLIISNAKKAEIGGRSQIRNSSSRTSNLAEDQLVGQISTYCASMILTGSPEGYIQARDKANANNHPASNDGNIRGSVILKNTTDGFAPSTIAASSNDLSKSIKRA